MLNINVNFIRYVFLNFFLICVLAVKGQQRVVIEFNPNTGGDYDLMLKDALNSNGYNATIRYDTLSSHQEQDFLVQYRTSSRSTYDQLSSLRLVLLDSNHNFVNSYKRKIPMINMGVNEAKILCEGLSSLFKKDFRCRMNYEKKEYSNFNINFKVHKIDSAVYAIVAMGAGIRTLEEVENAFLKKSAQFLPQFDYYVENRKYSYSAPAPGGSTKHMGEMVFGIIKPSSNELQNNKLSERPAEFEKEFSFLEK